MATADGAWHGVSPPAPIISKVCAGDSFVGGFTLELSQDKPVDECLRTGVAAASAATMTEATRLCDPDLTAQQRRDCVITKL